MTDGQSSGPGSPGSGSISSGDQANADQEMGLGAKAGEAVSKLAEAVQQVGSQAKDTATSLASEAGEKAKGLLQHQVEAGADFVGDVAQSVEWPRIVSTRMLRSWRGWCGEWLSRSRSFPRPCEFKR
jgi:hypothetical protein